MSSDQLIHGLLEQVEGSHFSFIRFVGRVLRHEWDWSPDEGIQSARDVVQVVLREEHRLLAKLEGTPAKSVELRALTTPANAAAALRALRESTLAALRRFLPLTEHVTGQHLIQSAVSLAQLDAHALGELVMLQRLIDPSRKNVSPR